VPRPRSWRISPEAYRRGIDNARADCWFGDAVGPVEPERRHDFERIVDHELATRVRRLAAPSEH
jgi:hypothetical protein